MYSYVKMEDAMADEKGKIIDVRWVIVNKGTKEEPGGVIITLD